MEFSVLNIAKKSSSLSSSVIKILIYNILTISFFYTNSALKFEKMDLRQKERF
jgi:hypothetical protein